MYYNPYREELKDDRIEVVSEDVMDDIKYILLKLHPNPINSCPNCNSTNTIKYGIRKRKVEISFLAHFKTDVTLEYSRFQCKDCLKIFADDSSLTNKGECISRSTKFSILLDLKNDLSFTYIANKNNVSTQTVINIFESFVFPKRRHLPDVICLDEFKNLKSAYGKYAFLILDPSEQKVVDVLEDRRLNILESYFYNIPWDERKNVKYIVTDMYEAYRTIKKKCFPNATHIIDTFHFLRYVEDAFNDVRIRIQGTFKRDTPQYKILKNNWRILSAYIIDVEGENLYNPLTKKRCNANQIISDSLELSRELTSAYELTQEFLKAIRTLKYEEAKSFMDNWIKTLSECNIKEFKDLAGMFDNWKDEITCSFIRFGERKLHNGYIEGINNRIKVIKRISYGYHNFHHFRARIMYIINEDVPLSKVDTTIIKRKPRKKKNNT